MMLRARILKAASAIGRTGDRGATGVEYAIMVSAIAGVIIVITYTLGLTVQGQFNALNALWP